ncbi:RNA-binding transcriptional accessory protein, partial [Peribacillus sp. SIMBA_075]
YETAERILKLIDADKKMIGRPEIVAKLDSLDLASLSGEWEIGTLTLKDIVDALKKPFRDPRDEFPQPLLKSDVLKMEDLAPGMEVQGT